MVYCRQIKRSRQRVISSSKQPEAKEKQKNTTRMFLCFRCGGICGSKSKRNNQNKTHQKRAKRKRNGGRKTETKKKTSHKNQTQESSINGTGIMTGPSVSRRLLCAIGIAPNGRRHPRKISWPFRKAKVGKAKDQKTDAPYAENQIIGRTNARTTTAR